MIININKCAINANFNPCHSLSSILTLTFQSIKTIIVLKVLLTCKIKILDL